MHTHSLETGKHSGARAVSDLAADLLSGGDAGSASRRRRVLAAVVVCDVVDSTGLARRLGPDAWSNVVDDLGVTTSALSSELGGRVVKSTGDGHILTFRTVTEAIRFSTSFMLRVGGVGVPHRVGVHVGEVEIDGDVRGLAVHAACRIVSMAEPGQVLVSSLAAEFASSPDFKFRDVGKFTLKGFKEDVTLLELFTSDGFSAAMVEGQ